LPSLRRSTGLALAGLALAALLQAAAPAPAHADPATDAHFCRYEREVPPFKLNAQVVYGESIACFLDSTELARGNVGQITISLRLQYRPTTSVAPTLVAGDQKSTPGFADGGFPIPGASFTITAGCRTGFYSGTAFSTVSFLSGEPPVLSASAATGEVFITCDPPPPTNPGPDPTNPDPTPTPAPRPIPPCRAPRCQLA
jgi:hypothetical protein